MDYVVPRPDPQHGHHPQFDGANFAPVPNGGKCWNIRVNLAPRMGLNEYRLSASVSGLSGEIQGQVTPSNGTQPWRIVGHKIMPRASQAQLFTGAPQQQQQQQPPQQQQQQPPQQQQQQRRDTGDNLAEQAGFLVEGGDIATRVSQDEARRICATNPDAMGFCFANGQPQDCFVKKHGTQFTADPNWTTMIDLMKLGVQQQQPPFNQQQQQQPAPAPAPAPAPEPEPVVAKSPGLEDESIRECGSFAYMPYTPPVAQVSGRKTPPHAQPAERQ